MHMNVCIKRNTVECRHFLFARTMLYAYGMTTKKCMHKGNDSFKTHSYRKEKMTREKVKRARKKGIRMVSEKWMKEEKKNSSV